MTEDEKTELLRKKFEAFYNCTHKFTRSAKGIYTNPHTATAWRWFLLGAQNADVSKTLPDTPKEKPQHATYWQLLNSYHGVDGRISRGDIPKSVIEKAIDSVKVVVEQGHWDDPFTMEVLINRIHTLPSNTLFSVGAILTFGSVSDAQMFGKKFKQYAETVTEDFTFLAFHKSRNIYRRRATKLNMMVMDSTVPLIYN